MIKSSSFAWFIRSKIKYEIRNKMFLFVVCNQSSIKPQQAQQKQNILLIIIFARALA